MAQEFFNECWRSTDGYINYQVSNLGRVRNATTGRILKPGKDKDGYEKVVLRKDNCSKTHKVHRLVARECLENPESKPCVDHIDHDKANNQMTNLRWATLSENQGNQQLQANTSSKYKGVSWHKRIKRWNAKIMHKGKRIHLGYFDDDIDAAKAYNAKAIELFGEYAYLNKFDDDNTLDYDDEDESETEATDDTAE